MMIFIFMVESFSKFSVSWLKSSNFAYPYNFSIAEVLERKVPPFRDYAFRLSYE